MMGMPSSSPAHYDVFLSHNSTDKPAVEELARRLQREGIEPWLDTWSLIPGARWQAALEAALATCMTCAVFVGPSGIGPWQDEEMRAAIDRRVRESNGRFRVIPVLLPGTERGERSALPTFLTATTWVEFRQTLDDAESVRRLVCGIRGIEPGPDPQHAAFVGTTPYRGLQVFDVADAPFFFGREALVEWLLTALRPASGTRTANRFLGILGPSGSGKSSLARAGLITAINDGQIGGSEQWPVAICTPRADPLESLALAVNGALSNTQNVTAVRRLIDEFRTDARTLHLTTRLALSEGRSKRWFVVLVDQFEELWTLCHDNKQRQAMIDTLLHAATVVDGQTIVILTLRADFYGKCAVYPRLAAALSDHQMLVGPMTRDELRRAIERPAQRAGAEFEPGLIEALLDDVQGEPGSLPLLQHALLELWNRRVARKLTHAAYQEIGGVEGALEQRAEAVFASFTPPEQVLCRRIFLRLMQPGEGTEDTRRRATVRELVPSNSDTVAFDAVLHKLADADARLVVTSSTQKGGDPANTVQREVVEVAHEALIRSWRRLRGWIDEDRTALRVHRQLTEAAEQWNDKGRDPSFLYVGVWLAEAQAWAATHHDDLNELERSFLDTSVAARDAQQRAAQRRTRWIIGGLVGALLVISTFAGSAAWFWRSAALSDQISRARYLVAESQNRVGDHPLLGLRLALEGVAVAPADDTKLKEALVATVRQIAGQGRVQKLSSAATSFFQSPDGTSVVFGSGQKPGQVWFVSTNTSIALAGPVGEVEFSPDGRSFVVQYAVDIPDELRRSTDGAVIAQLSKDSMLIVQPGGGVDAVAFSQDGRFFVVSGDETGQLRRSTDGAVLAQLAGHVHGVVFSPDGRSFVVWYMDDIPDELRRSTDGAVIAQLVGHVGSVEFSPDERFFVVWYSGETPDGSRRSNELRRSTDGAVVPLAGSVGSVEFSPDGRFFAVQYADDIPNELRRSTNGAVVPLAGRMYAVEFSPDGRSFVVGYADDIPNELRRSTDGAVLAQLAGRGENSVVFSPDGRSFVVWYIDDIPAELRRSTDGAVITQLVRSTHSVEFSRDGRFFVVSGDEIDQLRRSTDGAVLAQLAGPVENVVFSSDSTTFVRYHNGSSAIWNVEDRSYQLVSLGFAVSTVAIAPIAQKLVVHYQTGEMYLLDIEWLRALHGAPSSADLIRIACAVSFKNELWTQDDQQALEAALNGQNEQACK